MVAHFVPKLVTADQKLRACKAQPQQAQARQLQSIHLQWDSIPSAKILSNLARNVLRCKDCVAADVVVPDPHMQNAMRDLH